MLNMEDFSQFSARLNESIFVPEEQINFVGMMLSDAIVGLQYARINSSWDKIQLLLTDDVWSSNARFIVNIDSTSHIKNLTFIIEDLVKTDFAVHKVTAYPIKNRSSSRLVASWVGPIVGFGDIIEAMEHIVKAKNPPDFLTLISNLINDTNDDYMLRGKDKHDISWLVTKNPWKNDTSN